MEAYRTGVPFRSPLEQSDSFIAKKYPEFADTLDELEPNQRQALKQGLDPNRPEPDFVLDRPTIMLFILDEPGIGGIKPEVDVEIPRDLVDDYINAHQTWKSYMGGRSREDIEREREQFPYGSAQRNALNKKYFAVEDPYTNAWLRYRAYVNSHVQKTYNSEVYDLFPESIKGYGAKEFRAALDDLEHL